MPDSEGHWPSIVWREGLPYAAEEPARALTLDEAIDRVMLPALATDIRATHGAKHRPVFKDKAHARR